ncbi:MAG TPA: hypothetical protein EYP18_00300 [Desulfobacterales bacterium]|nr:hypothetical protein [Desulfobacterales bacterium]
MFFHCKSAQKIVEKKSIALFDGKKIQSASLISNQVKLSKLVNLIKIFFLSNGKELKKSSFISTTSIILSKILTFFSNCKLQSLCKNEAFSLISHGCLKA